MKKLLLSFFMLLTALGSWAHDFEVDGIYYKITSSTDLTVAVTYRGSWSYSYSNEYTGSVTIPETVTYNAKTYSVTSIGESAFDGCSSLTSIKIPNSVTSIGFAAFEGCTGLTSVTIPESVTSIGWRAFANTAWLDNQPNGLVYAGKVAYQYKGMMPENTEIILEDGTLGIAGYAFANCSGLTSITIPNSVISIGEGTFYNCSGLTSITIPNNVTSIGKSAFEYCTDLTSVTIGNGVTSIGEDAFKGCYGLTSVTIPNSLTSIGKSAFNWCSGLTKAEFASVESLCGIEFRSSDANPLYYAHHLYINGKEVTDLVIPNSVTSIGNYTFYNCSSLTSITIPNSVTSIGSSAFSECI